MKPTVLLYNFKDKSRLLKVRQALLPLGFRIKTVEKGEFGKPLGVLAGIKEMKEVGDEMKEEYDGPGFEDEMAVMAGFTSSQVDAFIYAPVSYTHLKERLEEIAEDMEGRFISSLSALARRFFSLFHK